MISLQSNRKTIHNHHGCDQPPLSNLLFLQADFTFTSSIPSNPKQPTRLNPPRKVPNFSPGVLSVKAYLENPNSFSSFANKVIGSLPVIGLVARIITDEGGVGNDIIDFAEFRRRVGKKCSITDSKAFYDFQDRRGRAGDPLYVLMCCWLAAVGAGLLKSEEILEGASRLRISNDIEFEEQKFIASMNEAREAWHSLHRKGAMKDLFASVDVIGSTVYNLRRAKSNAATPTIPMEARAEKALEAIYVCCFGKEPIEEDDERLLNTILSAVFPSVKQADIQRIVKDKAKRVAEGTDENSFPEAKPLSKEAVEMQMKDLKFLQQNRDD
ncbi:hypothetical protein JRO89_XS01G0241100 [Xanthoceras sorbifolium]|uniref:Photosystem I assembly factor PSA3, chloroplastic n=1 Tax=Xanthoceras sorbifolium TaxID=99658 RepID=A0ABQ8IKZ3_9ROSI|nr:hypothetical protein JRO89_XS01G0241100 [Xanthoceras sorbifolium]